MSYTAHEEEIKGFTLKIVADDSPESPREWDNLGTMVCFARRYDLGDKHNHKDPESFFADLWITEATQEEKRAFILKACKGNIGYFREIIQYVGRTNRPSIDDLFSATVDRIEAPKEFPNSVIFLNLYLYDHGGITMNTGGYSCPWDSGQVGWIYVTEAKLKAEGLSDRTPDQVREYLDGEVKTYAQYLEGDVYGYVVSKTNTCDCCQHEEEEVLESCWGFYGTEDAISEGKSMIEALSKE